MTNYRIEAEQINLFDERWYKVEEDYYPSVTTYLEVYPKGAGYYSWLQNTKDPMALRDEAAQIGTETHRLIELCLKGEEVVYCGQNIRVWERFVAWSNWFKDLCSNHVVEIIDIERILVSTELRYAGTCDLIALIDNELTVFDWKTGSFIGYTAEMQVAAYANIVGAPKAVIVQINTDTDANGKQKVNKKGYREYPVKDLVESFEFFLMCQKIWNKENPNAKPKFKTLPLSINLKDLQ